MTPASSPLQLIPHGAGWGTLLAFASAHSPWVLTVFAGVTVSTWAWCLQQIGQGLLARIVRTEHHGRELERRVQQLEAERCPFGLDHAAACQRLAAAPPTASGEGSGQPFVPQAEQLPPR